MSEKLHLSNSSRTAKAGAPGVWTLRALSLTLFAGAGLAGAAIATEAGAEPGTPAPRTGLAIRAAKALVCGREGRETIDGAMVLVENGLIQAVGRDGEVEVPEGYELLDVGESWVMPGIIDMHTHSGGVSGYNDMVYQLNPGLRVSATVIPGNDNLGRPLATGITTILYLPGSGTNIGGQGVLMKTREAPYEKVVIRDPGSMKLAQGDNPKRWGYRMDRALMNHHIRYSLREGKAYAKRWARYEKEGGPKPERRINLDIYRDLLSEATAISVHTQYFQVVLSTLRILRMEFGFPTYIDHGSFDSYKLGGLAEEIGVPAILGPREVMFPSPGRFSTDGRFEGTAWGFQQAGTSLIGFNTDAPVVPLEELPLQSAMGVRYGFDNSRMDAARGLTIVPAIVGGLSDRLGSLDAGKLADIVVIGGDPSDPRSAVERVWIEGEQVYEREAGAQRW